MTRLLPHFRRGAVVLAALIAVSVAIALRAFSADAAGGSGSITFEGGGWGHAVGLSQYGAYGLAKTDGWTAEQILTHYYAGTSLVPLDDDVAAPRRLWVNLEREAVEVDLTARSGAASGAPVVVTRHDERLEVAPGGTVTIEVVPGSTTEPLCEITANGLTTTGPCSIDLAWDGDVSSPSTRVELSRVRRRTDTFDGARCTNADWNTSPTTYRTCTYSRGELRIRPDDNSSSFNVVGVMDVEDYVLGISEMPYAWGLTSGGSDGAAALEAQAIAARTYALRRGLDRGAPEERANCWCHVVDTTADQRYVGWGHSGLGQQAWLDAVRRTEGMILTHPAETRNGAAIPIEAFYSSSTFGRTEPSELVFGGARPYLVSVDDTRAHDPVAGNPNARWQRTLTVQDISRRLGWSGDRTVARVEITECSPSGAAATIRFTDEDGAGTERTLSQLRGLLGTRSPQIVAIGGVSPCSGPPAAPGSIAAGGLRIDDGSSGDSVGNGDGAAQCGETVELRTGVNNGLGHTISITGARLTVDDDYASLLHNDGSAFDDIAAGGTGMNEDDWDIQIASRTPAFHMITLSLQIQDPATTLEWELPVTCADPAEAPYAVASVTVDDDGRGDSVGNADGAARCGETVELDVRLRRTGDTEASNVQAAFAVERGGSLLHNTTSTYPALAPGQTAVNEDDFDVVLGPVAGTLRAWITITDDRAASWRLPVRVPVACDEDVRVTAGDVVVDDGVNGDSRGNLDRTVQCGETVELFVPLEASTTLDDVTVALRTNDPYVSIVHNRTSASPGLAPGSFQTNTDDWDLAIAELVPDGHVARFRVVVRSRGVKVARVPVRVPIGCPQVAASPIRVEALTVDDGSRGDSVGDGDRVADCGETIELYVALEGLATGSNVRATLTSRNPATTILYNTASEMALSGGLHHNTDDWDIAVATGLRARLKVAMELDVEEDGQTTRIPFVLVLRCAAR